MSGKQIKLNIKIETINDPVFLIKNKIKGKSVLNIGAAGGVEGYLPNNKEVWLHYILKKSANKLVGVDLDKKSIKYAKDNGVEIIEGNCETMALDEKFDVIVMSDVIEHVDAPVVAIRNLLAHLSESGVLIITTPNGTAGNLFVRSLFRKSFNVLDEHVAIYFPEHFEAICQRIGAQLSSIYMFDLVDRKSIKNLFKSYLFKLMTLVSPRLASSMMVIIKNTDSILNTQNYQ